MRLPKLLVSCVASMCCALSTASAENFTDHWSKADEPGWGLVITHQGDTLFAVLFAYDGERNPTWYAIPNLGKDAGGDSYKGLVYRTSGPPVTATFDPSQVQVRQVGDAEFTPNADGSATFTHTIEGVKTTKTIRRLTFRNAPIEDVYFIQLVGKASSCTNPAHDSGVGRPFLQAETWIIRTGTEGGFALDRIVDGDIIASFNEPIQVQFSGLATAVTYRSRTFPSGKGGVANLKLASVDSSGFIGELTVIDDPVYPGCIVRANISGLRAPA